MFSLDYWKNLVIEKFLKSYLTDFVKRLEGYKTLTGGLLTVFQIAVQLVTNDSASGVLQILIDSFSGVATASASGEQVSIFSSSLLAIYGAGMKIYKAYKNEPQVPFEMTPVESVVTVEGNA